MTKMTRYYVRYWKESRGTKMFTDATAAVEFALAKQKENRLVEVGQVDTEVVTLKTIEGVAFKELKGAK